MNISVDSPAPAVSDPQWLANLAEIAVRIGLGLAPEQELIVTAPVEGLPLIRQITKQAYLSEASLVTTIFTDEQTILTRLRYAPDKSFDQAPKWLFGAMADAFRSGAARLALSGDDPTLLVGQDQGKIARANRARAEAMRPAAELFANLSTNWTIVPCATAGWARAVFPGEAPRRALSKLWDAIFSITRADRPDSIAAWQAHIAAQRERARILDGKHYSKLRFRGPDTDLAVGLADGYVWAGGSATTTGGLSCLPNIPNEEIFTAPHRDRVNGFVTSTRPLVVHGNTISDIAMRFSEGKVVEVKARGGAQVLQRLLDTDDGARRLGEVALVPHSSPISQSGLLFYNTLLDENAASHVALGQAYSKTIRHGDRMSHQDLTATGANRSLVHVDLMIGSAEVDVDGMTAAGDYEPIMRSGEWVF
jgi:aminopeptidase